MTHNNHENLSMMDAVTTKYGKTNIVQVSKTLAITLVFIFFICLIATGLLVYSFTSACSKNETLAREVLSGVEKTPNVQMCNKSSEIIVLGGVEAAEVTTTSTTPKPVVVDTKLGDNYHIKRLPEDLDIRLPNSVFPHSYQIHLIPFIQEGNFTFHGRETILINVTERCSNITLHADTLTIDRLSVMNVDNQSVSVRDVRMLKKKQFLVIDLDEELSEGGQYLVDIEFKGVLTDMLGGFYRSSYVENNVTRWIAVTQFQPTEARTAFPCFDEPAFKAKFQINIARMKNMTSISNMPRIDSTNAVEGLPDYVWDHYEESLPMSTYLVAFVVSDFKNISKGLFTIWARPSALSQAKFSIEIGPGILKYYEQFFGIKYPLPKVDMVAIPDFEAGAMENWGLITYREPVLLYEKGVSSIASKHRIAHVIAHELAHQWFGNLVTPVWWEDLWLNEGFATHVEFLGSYAVNPKWKDPDLFLVTELQESLNLDALKSSHPISVKVNNPNEVEDIFDRISYSKGASVIRMMQNFLGDEVFHMGLYNYLKSKMYGNAEQDDLWQFLTNQSLETKILPENTTVKEIMDTWTLQTGFPVVTAINKNGDLVITQERFLLDHDNKEEDKTLWWVPITVIDSDENIGRAWMQKEKEIVLKNIISNDSAWFLVNILQNGYYRVNYAEENWKSLIHQLQGNGHKLIPPRNRAQMLDDAMKLAYAGYLNYNTALNVTLYLINEREYVPWKAALLNFEFLYDMFVRSANFDKFKSYMLSLLKDFYLELTFKESPNDEPTKVLNRMEIVDLACRLGLKDCVLQAVQQFQNWRNSANPDKENLINPDLRQTVYCTAISDGGQEEWDFAWNRYLNTNVASDKEIMLSSLACSKEIWILSRYLEWSITENSGIRKHDTARVFASISENPVGHDLVYRFLKTNWQRVLEYLGTSMSLSSIVKTTTEKFNTEEEVNDFKSFFERKKEEFGVALRTAQQSLEQAEANTKWMKKYFESVRNWLENI